MKRLISIETVEAAHAAGTRTLSAPFKEAIVTPAAQTKASELGIAISYASENAGSSDRVTDASGVTVVRGSSVKLGAFNGTAVGLTDVITKKDGSPMGAGIMAWSRDDSFPWTLTYDEIDLVLEGTLHIGIDGRVIEGRAGDMFYIPKGSRIVFGTPDRVRVFYVTHPANWAG
jgi:ethanolamine utilization protein EutQ